jgi:hypothetical protein
LAAGEAVGEDGAKKGAMLQHCNEALAESKEKKKNQNLSLSAQIRADKAAAVAGHGCVALHMTM